MCLEPSNGPIGRPPPRTPRRTAPLGLCIAGHAVPAARVVDDRLQPRVTGLQELHLITYTPKHETLGSSFTYVHMCLVE